MTAGLHRDFLQLGVKNALVRPGAATMLGSPVNLAQVNRDSYLVAGIADHLCPWLSCYRSTALLGGAKRFVLSSSGHIAAMVNPPGNEKASCRPAGLCGRRPGVAAARGVPARLLVAGLRGVAGKTLRTEKDAPAEPGGAGLTALCAAPRAATSMTADQPASPARGDGRWRWPRAWTARRPGQGGPGDVMRPSIQPMSRRGTRALPGLAQQARTPRNQGHRQRHGIEHGHAWSPNGVR